LIPDYVVIPIRSVEPCQLFWLTEKETKPDELREVDTTGWIKGKKEEERREFLFLGNSGAVSRQFFLSIFGNTALVRKLSFYILKQENMTRFIVKKPAALYK
jgi:hypothetical protein